MARLGRALNRDRLRRTTLCQDPATIVDTETLADIKGLLKESAEEIWNPITVRNYESGVVDPTYGEAITKTFIDYTLYGHVNLQPSDKELTDLGIREPVDILIRMLITEVDRVLTPLGKKIDTDDRIVYDGIVYSVYRVSKGRQYKGQQLWQDIVAKVYSAQSTRNQP